MRKNTVCFVAFMIAFGLFSCSDGGGGSSSNGNGSSAGNVTGKVTLSSLVSQAGNTQNKTHVRNAISYAPASGAVPVLGAICTVEGTDKSGTTDQDGLFMIKGVSPGSHILICKKTAINGNTYAFLKIVEVANGQSLDIGTL
jgi:hypothetical protein